MALIYGRQAHIVVQSSLVHHPLTLTDNEDSTSRVDASDSEKII